MSTISSTWLSKNMLKWLSWCPYQMAQKRFTVIWLPTSLTLRPPIPPPFPIQTVYDRSSWSVATRITLRFTNNKSDIALDVHFPIWRDRPDYKVSLSWDMPLFFLADVLVAIMVIFSPCPLQFRTKKCSQYKFLSRSRISPGL